MEKISGMIYKPQVKKMGIYFLGSCIMLLGEVMLLWVLLSSKVAIEMKLFLSIFFFLCLFYCIYFFIFPLITRLGISKNGITYSQPLFIVFCEWKNLTGMRFTKDRLFITFNERAKVNNNIIEKILIGRQRIPLEIFVNNFNKIDDWSTDPVLLELQKYIPNLADEVKKIIT